MIPAQNGERIALLPRRDSYRPPVLVSLLYRPGGLLEEWRLLGMEQNTDILSVIAEPGALTFATRKEWQELPEVCLDELSQHETVLVFKGTESVFLLLRNIRPGEYLNDNGRLFRLVQISIDEDGKQVLHIMNLSGAEAVQLIRNRLTIWG